VRCVYSSECGAEREGGVDGVSDRALSFGLWAVGCALVSIISCMESRVVFYLCFAG